VHLGEAAIRTFPKLGIGHGSQEVTDLLSLVLSVGLNLESINLLQNLGFFLQELLKTHCLLLAGEFRRVLDLLGFVQSPSFQLIIQDFEILRGLGVHSPFDFLLMFLFFFGLELLLEGQELLFAILLRLAQIVAAFACEPASNTALNIEGGLLSLLEPHDRGEVPARVENFIVTAVNEDASLLHLGAMLTHHVRRLGLVLVGLDHTLILVGVVVDDLISL